MSLDLSEVKLLRCFCSADKPCQLALLLKSLKAGPDDPNILREDYSIILGSLAFSACPNVYLLSQNALDAHFLSA